CLCHKTPLKRICNGTPENGENADATRLKSLSYVFPGLPCGLKRKDRFSFFSISTTKESPPHGSPFCVFRCNGRITLSRESLLRNRY
ncbi:MAG: hypothetical protein AB1649_28510, partial [Chloroflexota bacterium]